MSTPSRLVFQLPLPPSFPYFSSATGDSQSAIIRPRNCSERHFLAPFLGPLLPILLVCPFYIVSIAYLPAVSNHPYAARRRTLSSLPPDGLLFNHLVEYGTYSCDRENRDQMQRLEHSCRGWKRVTAERERERARLVVEEWWIPPQNSTKHRKQCLRI